MPDRVWLASSPLPLPEPRQWARGVNQRPYLVLISPSGSRGTKRWRLWTYLQMPKRSSAAPLTVLSLTAPVLAQLLHAIAAVNTRCCSRQQGLCYCLVIKLHIILCWFQVLFCEVRYKVDELWHVRASLILKVDLCVFWGLTEGMKGTDSEKICLCTIP